MAEAVGAEGTELVKEGAGVATTFVRTLGLTDIIFGSLLVYWVRVFIPHADWPQILPSTGHDWVDVALMASVAALVGKALSFFIHGWTAVVDIASDRLNSLGLGYSAQLRHSLDEYSRRGARVPTGKHDDVRDLAAAYAAAASPDTGAALEHKRDAITIANTGALITGLYTWYFAVQPSLPRALALALGCGAFALFLVGVVTQLDYVHTLHHELEILLHHVSSLPPASSAPPVLPSSPPSPTPQVPHGISHRHR